MAAEGEHGQGDQRVGGTESERNGSRRTIRVDLNEIDEKLMRPMNAPPRARTRWWFSAWRAACWLQVIYTNALAECE